MNRKSVVSDKLSSIIIWNIVKTSIQSIRTKAFFYLLTCRMGEFFEEWVSYMIAANKYAYKPQVLCTENLLFLLSCLQLLIEILSRLHFKYIRPAAFFYLSTWRMGELFVEWVSYMNAAIKFAYKPQVLWTENLLFLISCLQ